MIEQNIFTIIFAIFILFTVRDVFVGQANQQPHQHAQPHLADIDSKSGLPHDSNIHKYHQKNYDVDALTDGRPTVKIQYCQSCGYRQAFEDIKLRLEKEMPMCVVEGEIHRPDFMRSQLANFVFLAKAAFFIMVYFRFDPFAHFQMPTPRFWHFVMDNRMAASVMVMLFASSVESNMMSTGAFEIFYNDIPIWSKIQKGRMPYMHEILTPIKTHMGYAKSKMYEL